MRSRGIALECVAHLIPPLAGFFLGGNRRRNGAGADHGEKGILNSVIDAQTAKGNARGSPLSIQPRLQL